MKKLLIIALAFVPTIQAMQPQTSQLLLAAKNIVHVENKTSSELASSLQEFIQNNPQFKEQLNNAHVRQEIIIPIITKIFQEQNMKSSFERKPGIELAQKITQIIDSLGAPSVSKWLRDDFTFFKLSTNLHSYYYAFVTQENPTIADLVHAVNEQLQVPTGRTARILLWEPFTVLNPVPGTLANALPSTTPLKSLGIPRGTDLGITFSDSDTK